MVKSESSQMLASLDMATGKSARAPGQHRVTLHEGQGNAVVSEDLRRLNRAQILLRLFSEGVMSRTALASSTGLTRAAISRISDELIEIGLVKESIGLPVSAGRGRPQVGLALEAGAAFVVGIGIGAFEQSVQITDLRGESLARTSSALLQGASPAGAMRRLSAQVRALVKEANVPPARVLGVVIAVAGVVDHAAGVVLESPNIGWRNVPLADGLNGSLHWPVYVEAMHHVLNLAESLRSVRPSASSTVLVNVAMGIGASVIEAGRVVRGSHAAAGQIGHLRVIPDGELCTCGKQGCLDTVASGFAILRRLGRIPERRVAREHSLAEAALLTRAIAQERQDQADVREAFHHCGAQLGQILEAVRAIADPAQICLAGPVSEVRSFVEGVLAGLNSGKSGGEGVEADIPITFSMHTADAAAALLALHRFAFSTELNLAQLRPA
jgi:predicted NBD/HSP70 family sugar kinase